MSANLHISISAEPIWHFGQLAVSNSIFTSLIVTTLILAFAVGVNLQLTAKKAGKKISTLQNIAEFLVEGLYGLTQSVTNDHGKTRNFLPLILSFFVFILCNNWFGLLPGVGSIGFKEVEGEKTAMVLQQDLSLPAVQAYASETSPLKVVEATGEVGSQPIESQTGIAPATEAPVAEAPEAHAEAKFVPYFRAGTADLNTTLALAIITALSAQIWGFSYLHLGYLKKFFNFSNPIMFFVGILELVSEFSKVLSYAFRLFGNVFAGEVLLAVMGALVPLVVPMVFYGLEIFVGAIQAFVFSLLSIIFYQVATLGHEEHESK